MAVAQALSTSERAVAPTHSGASSRRQHAERARRQARLLDRRPCATRSRSTRSVLQLPIVITTAPELPSVPAFRAFRLLSIHVAGLV